MTDLIFRDISNYMADLENGLNYRFLLDFTATEELPSLGYIVLRAMNMFNGLSVPDPTVFRSLRYFKTILAVEGHHHLHHSSLPVD